MLHDWIRRPVKDSLVWSMAAGDGDPTTSRRRGVRRFPVHNKYTTAAWQWLLHESVRQILVDGEAVEQTITARAA